jgi:uncharacterized protein
MERDSPHLPRPSPIEAYGKGGFRFAGMSHHGSLLCLPSGIWASAVTLASGIDDSAVARVLTETPLIELFLVGAGRDLWIMPKELCARFRDAGIAVEVMTTSTAASTYNVLLGEGRRIGALLIAVE